MPISISLAELNRRDRHGFVAAIGHAFEHSPWIAEAAWGARPFADLSALHAALCAVVAGAGPERQLALIRAHPDLAGRLARAGQIGAESTQEQLAAGLDALGPAEAAQFDAYNGAYRERFGFPFVICARENKKATILAAFPRRLANTREDEIIVALAEIAKIARLRLQDCVAPDEPTDEGSHMSVPPTRAPASRGVRSSRMAIALLVFIVLLLFVVAVGDVLFAGTSGPGPGPTSTPTSLLVPHAASAIYA